MKDSIRLKLESVRDRFEEIAGLLADPDVIADQNQFRDLSKEYSRVEPVVKSFEHYEGILDDIAAAEEMANDSDDDVREMVTIASRARCRVLLAAVRHFRFE